MLGLVWAGGEVVIGPEENESGEAQPDHKELAASGGLIAGWFVGVGSVGGHDSIQV
jgi:hypothetical protein